MRGFLRGGATAAPGRPRDRGLARDPQPRSLPFDAPGRRAPQAVTHADGGASAHVRLRAHARRFSVHPRQFPNSFGFGRGSGEQGRSPLEKSRHARIAAPCDHEDKPDRWTLARRPHEKPNDGDGRVAEDHLDGLRARVPCSARRGCPRFAAGDRPSAPPARRHPTAGALPSRRPPDGPGET